MASVIRSQRSLLVHTGTRLSLLHRACIFLRELMTECILRHDALLVQRVIYCLRGTQTVRVPISTLLLLVHILAQTSLLLR